MHCNVNSALVLNSNCTSLLALIGDAPVEEGHEGRMKFPVLLPLTFYYSTFSFLFRRGRLTKA